MKVFYESKLAKMLLFPGYSTITLGCFVFTKNSKNKMKQFVLNHESIHVTQWKETTLVSILLFLFLGYLGLSMVWLLLAPLVYYAWYLIEYVLRLGYWWHKGIQHTTYRNISHAAYRNISFESEAYANQLVSGYTNVRKFFEVIYYFR